MIVLYPDNGHCLATGRWEELEFKAGNSFSEPQGLYYHSKMNHQYLQIWLSEKHTPNIIANILLVLENVAYNNV